MHDKDTMDLQILIILHGIILEINEETLFFQPRTKNNENKREEWAYLPVGLGCLHQVRAAAADGLSRYLDSTWSYSSFSSWSSSFFTSVIKGKSIREFEWRVQCQLFTEN
jgi:hypothetical protein